MSEPAGSPPTPPGPEKTGDWARSVLWIAVLFFVTINVVLVAKTCSRAPGAAAEAAGRAIEKAGQALASVVSAFQTGRVTTEFITYASSLHPTHRLQFATLKQSELFSRTDEASTAFGYVPLPDVIVEARAPVEYTYYLDLNAPWKLVLENGVIHVLAPKIQFNQPAVDVSAIRFEVRKGSVFRNTEESLAGLRNSITQLSRQKARANVPLIRETGRKQTAEFVERWLSRQFSDGAQHPVKVYFPGETLPPALERESSGQLLPGSIPPTTEPLR